MAYYSWKHRCGEIWNRLGPSALAVAIVGVGVSGAIQIVQAQDPVIIAEKDKQAAEKKADEKSKLSKEEREKLEAQLETLSKERMALDSKMRDLQKKLGIQREIRVLRNGEGAFVFPEGKLEGLDNLKGLIDGKLLKLKELGPEHRIIIEKEMKTAHEQMQRAMVEAHRSQKGVKKFHELRGEAFHFEMPEMPRMPEMRFFMNRGEKLTPEQEKEWKARAEKMGKEWEARGPEWERWAQQFEARMQRWAQQFEARMQRGMQDRGGKGKSKKESPKEAPKEGKFFDDFDVIIGSAVKPLSDLAHEVQILETPEIVEREEIVEEKEAPEEKPKKKDKQGSDAL